MNKHLPLHLARILFLLITIGLGSGRASLPIKAIWVSDEFNASKKSVIDRVEKNYCDQKKIRFDEFEAIHYTNKNNSENELVDRGYGKKKVFNFSNRKITCDYQACTELGTIIKKNEDKDITLLWCSSRQLCSSEFDDIEVIRVSEGEIVNNLISISNKKRRVETLVIIYLAGANESPKPTVSISPDTILVEVDEKVQLKPEYKGDLAAISWSPTLGLSCADCRQPTVTIESSTTYSVQVTANNGCVSDEKSVHLKLNNPCLTGNQPPELKLLEVIIDDDGNKVRTKFEKVMGESNAQWRVLSNQTGGDIYDLVTTSSCGECFQLHIYNDLGEKIKVFTYRREEIDFRAQNRYHRYWPKDFVFRMDLSNVESIRDPERAFSIVIYAFKRKCDNINWENDNNSWGSDNNSRRSDNNSRGNNQTILKSANSPFLTFDHCDSFIE